MCTPPERMHQINQFHKCMCKIQASRISFLRFIFSLLNPAPAIPACFVASMKVVEVPNVCEYSPPSPRVRLWPGLAPVSILPATQLPPTHFPFTSSEICPASHFQCDVRRAGWAEHCRTLYSTRTMEVIIEGIERRREIIYNASSFLSLSLSNSRIKTSCCDTLSWLFLITL